MSEDTKSAIAWLLFAVIIVVVAFYYDNKKSVRLHELEMKRLELKISEQSCER